MQSPDEPHSGRAIELAERQLSFLRGGDIDAFLAHEGEYHAACGELMGRSGDPAGAKLLQYLTLLHGAIIHELRCQMDETAGRMAALASHRRAGHAYRSPRAEPGYVRASG